MKSDYPQLNFVEIDNWNFNVHLHTGKLIGTISIMEAGYFVFNFIEKPVGYISAWLFHQIADKLDELNQINDAKIMDDLAKCEAQVFQPEPAEETDMQHPTPPVPLLAARESTHGSYANTAELAQALKVILRTSRNWHNFSSVQRESLELICTKLARIGSGRHSEPDHWADIAGYAELVVIELENQNPKLAGG